MENKIQTHNYKVIHRETYEKVNKKAANVTKQALAQPPPQPPKKAQQGVPCSGVFATVTFKIFPSPSGMTPRLLFEESSV